MSNDAELMTPEQLPSYGFNLKNDQRKHLEARGQFPKRVWISARRHAYVVSEIRAHARQKIAERDSQ